MLEVGIDLVTISRFQNRSDRLAQTFLTGKEMKLYSSLKEEKTRNTFLAERWACKEAIFKATQDLHFTEYSILNEPNGKPYVDGHSEMKLSISHDSDMVVAIVIYES